MFELSNKNPRQERRGEDIWLQRRRMEGEIRRWRGSRRDGRMRLEASVNKREKEGRCVAMFSLTARFDALIPACIRQRIQALASSYCNIHERLS